MSVLRRELFIFALLALIFAPIMHPDLLSTPYERYSSMIERGNYLHPFLYSLLVYSAVGILRILFLSIKKIFSFAKS
jgi:hypothetical protein